VTTPSDDRLREDFASAQNIAVDVASCPDTSLIWGSAAEELTGDENESLLRHTTTCGACAAAWRLARELLAEDLPQMLSDETSGKPIDEPSRFAGGRRPTARSRPWWLGLAAAATLVLAVSFLAIQQFQNVGPDEPVYRTPSGGGLASEIDPSTPMPRDDLILRWSGAPDGTTYDLRVTTDRLAPLHRTFGIERTEHSVPEDALADLPPGAVILWNVTAHLPDGRRWTSNSFRATVE
jgi:hypothetical protein